MYVNIFRTGVKTTVVGPFTSWKAANAERLKQQRRSEPGTTSITKVVIPQ